MAEVSRNPVYKTKVVQFGDRTTPIVLQNNNGPCPLLAICNVLLLKNIINLSVDGQEVTQQKLLSLVKKRLKDSNSNLQNKADALDLLPRLATGIDVNVRFKKIDDFEFTPACAIFDLLGIALYHGWIVDPKDVQTEKAIRPESYNTHCSKFANGSSKYALSQEGQLTNHFLKTNASQLTVHGLICLQDGLKERELCIFFRNNHFSTMYKYKGELYLLVTDEGYINQPDLVWEKLNEGNTFFMTGNFTPFKVENRVSESWNEQQAMTSTADYFTPHGNPDSSLPVTDSEFDMAMTLQKEADEKQKRQQQLQQQQQQRQQRQLPYPQRPPRNGSRPIVDPQDYLTPHGNPHSSQPDTDSDLQLARALQEEEYEQQLPYPPRPPGSSSRPQQSGASNVQQRHSECTIL